MKTTVTLFFIFLTVSINSYSQHRVLLRIKDGKQEAYPLQKGERTKDVIEQIENEPADYVQNINGLIDTLKYFPGSASAGANVLTTNFGFGHQDVALQWYDPEASGVVKELWWYNLAYRGDINKGTIRAWYVDPKLATLPTSFVTKAIGYYKDPNDGDGNSTPFKPTTGDQFFYKTGGSDSTILNFDPLGTESSWLHGGLQVTLDSMKWQGVKLDDFGDTLKVNTGQLFGFTLMNDYKLPDMEVVDIRMEIGSIESSGAPYHSLKFYETGRNNASDRGWWLRGEYEWGMYVVVEYTTCRAPKIIPSFPHTTLDTLPQKMCFSISADCNNTTSTVFAIVKHKIGSRAEYDSTTFPCMNNEECCVEIPGGKPGDTIYYYITAIDDKGNRTTTPARNYRIFKKTKSNLLLYNNAQYPLGTANLIYTSASPAYDRWSAPADGIIELDTLLSLYNNVLLADGSFPSRNVYTSIAKWLASGTSSAKKNLFFTSQDYGCYITGTCADTTFAAGSWEHDYLGIETLGPQDIPPKDREYRIVPTTNPETNYLWKYEKDSNATLWYDPTFEVAFAGYIDGLVPTPNTDTLFTNANGTIVHGIELHGSTFNTLFLAFDAGALQFRSDTSIAPPFNDPKYQWIVDVGSLAQSYFSCACDPWVDVPLDESKSPKIFSLLQNYPNPFNPTTTFEYNIPTRSAIDISIYNVLGQKIATLVNDIHEAGQHRITWNGKDGFGKPVASGIYFYQMKAGSYQSVKKMVLMK